LAWRLALASLGLLAHSTTVKGETSAFDFDLAIVGGGSAGYAAARTAAADGLKTVVIEGGEEVGGLCILRGCMPTKALLYAAEVLHLASHARAWGVRAPDVGFNFGEVMRRKNALIKEFADFRQQQLAGGKFQFFRAHARFVDTHTVELAPVRTSGSRREKASKVKAESRRPKAEMDRSLLTSAATLTARNFIIATGSIIAPAPLPQIDELDCLNSDTALKLERLPKSLLVLGGGAVAVEFAQFFARFSVKVMMIQRSPHILHEFDFDASSELEAVFRREGIQLYAGTRLLDARRVAAQKEVTFAHNEQKVRVQAEEVFFGLGRRPNVAGLGLERLGVRLESGRIFTDANMRSSVPHIFAAGDCTSPNEIEHLAVHRGEISSHNVAHAEGPSELDYRVQLDIILSEPKVAPVGRTV